MGRLDKARKAAFDQPQAVYDDQGRAMQLRPGEYPDEARQRGVPLTGAAHENRPQIRGRSNG